MNEKMHYLFIGLGFLILGSVMLLEEFRIIRIDESYTIAALCLLGCIALFHRYQNNKNIFMLILSAVLFFISSAIIIDSIAFMDDAFIGILLFILVAGLFLHGYTLDRNKIGLLIPAGICLTLASVIFLDTVARADGEFIGSMFFLGVGLTFGFMYLMRDQDKPLEWAKILAIGFIAFAVFVFIVSSDYFDGEVCFPLLMIAVGGYLIYRGRRNGSLMAAK